MHIILEIRKSMSDSYNNIPYIRLLGFNKTGQQYLGSIKKELDVPFITKAADYKNELIFDLACSDIYAQAVYEKYGVSQMVDVYRCLYRCLFCLHFTRCSDSYHFISHS